MKPAAPKTALLLAGGGARGAYQVGVLRSMARAFPELRFPIILDGKPWEGAIHFVGKERIYAGGKYFETNQFVGNGQDMSQHSTTYRSLVNELRGGGAGFAGGEADPVGLELLGEGVGDFGAGFYLEGGNLAWGMNRASFFPRNAINTTLAAWTG